ncbi:MAG: GTP pyrophosphokinase family protein [Lachnospiraceae bacterium]|nr:GTP pyrophosphokinase family protein [Lachnospiraceae bacterium]
MDMESRKEVQLVYSSALKEMEIRLEILNDEFQHVHQYNPIEHIKARIKTAESIEKKLRKHGYEPTVENMVKHVNDIAGIRIICSFTTDVYRIAQMLERHRDLDIIYVKDYIKKPKRSGYKSYHMLVSIPVYLSEKKVEAKVEIQIRTVAMDFWASLEHKINYKFAANVPSYIKEELSECAKMVSELDAKMLSLNEEVKALELE